MQGLGRISTFTTSEKATANRGGPYVPYDEILRKPIGHLWLLYPHRLEQARPIFASPKPQKTYGQTDGDQKGKAPGKQPTLAPPHK